MKDMPERTAAGHGELSVCLVVGRLPSCEEPNPHCGVRDYTTCLAEALCSIGVAARVVAPKSWSLHDGISFMGDLRRARPDIVHLQYPSLGYRHSLLPHMLGLSRAGRSFVVTLHENSALPALQRTANRLFRASADRIIFTTELEARASAAPDTLVIPIGSNVPVHPHTPDRANTVLYFGQIRPSKGFESFVELTHLAEAADETARFLVMGSVPVRWRSYADAQRAQLPPDVEWVEDAPFAAVAQAMATASAAYLPFPDGAGWRRGSLIAALANGLPVIAPVGPSTPDELRSILLPADTPRAALAQLQLLLERPSIAHQLVSAGRKLVHPFGWPTIAEAHVALYRSALVDRGVGEAADVNSTALV